MSRLADWQWQPCSAPGWRRMPAKRAFSITLGKMLQGRPTSRFDKEVPYLKARHVQWDGVCLTDLPMMWGSENEINGLEVRQGDLLVCEGGEVGRAATVQSEPTKRTIIQNALHLVRGKAGADPRFLSYLLRHAAGQGWFDVVCNKATIAHFTVEKFGNIWIWLPPATTQRVIADYLDRETARIDALIAVKKRTLALLEERRRALITQAVTRGLDSSVALRDAGIPWLGAIPAHWRLGKLRFTVTECRNGVWGEEPDGVRDLICIRVADFDRVRFRVRLDSPTLRAVDRRTAEPRLLEPGVLLLEKSGGGEKQPVGAVVLYDHSERAVCSNFVARMRPASDCDPPYLTYLHAALYAARVNVRSIKQSTGIQNLDSASYLDEKVGLPELSEQRAIAAFLDRETAKLDALARATERTIALLRERRAALIAAAVTGQVALDAAA